MKKFIIVLSVVLFFLILVTILIGNSLKRRESPKNVAISPVPQIPYEAQRGTTVKRAPTLAPLPQDEGADDFPFSRDEESALSKFQKLLPYSSPDFDVGYSPILNQYFVQKKTPDAEKKLDELLKNNNLADIRTSRPALFIFTDAPVDQVIRKKESEVLKRRTEQAEAQIRISPPAVAPQKKDIDLLVKLVESLTKINQPSPSPGIGTCATGGYPFPDRGQNLIGRPYSGTHTLGNWQSDNAVDLGTPVGTPVCAIADGTLGPRIGDSGSGGRYAGIRLTLITADNEWFYHHMSELAQGIQGGTQVRAGQILGLSGSANGVPHLHLGVKSGNPLDLLGL
ncbi:M23 family metallopeptidase [Candidatus Roizmanbacteria bacterium]|nr:M23 family metallopeptidase [Candidatus Roizmanbacteria bacterium]